LWRILAIFFNGILPVVILCCLLIPIQPFKKKLLAKFRQKREIKNKKKFEKEVILEVSSRQK
jgi:hypothetical protein